MEYTLYHSYTSAYVRKVCVLLHELDLMKKTKILPGLSDDAKKNHPNPLVKIPTLITEDCGPIFDSTVICEYLDLKHAKGKFFPVEFDIRIKTLKLHSLSAGMIDATVACFYEEKKPTDLQNAALIFNQEQKIRNALSALEAELDFIKSNWNIASINTAVAIDYINFRKAEINIASKFKKLHQWSEQLDYPSLKLTVPKIV